MIQRSLNRRGFLQHTAVLAASTLRTLNARLSRRVVKAEFDLDKIHTWDGSSGDTWDPLWADDDQLSSFSCDGRGFGPNRMNLAFTRFDGRSLPTMSGVHGLDNATWKVCGQNA